MIFGAFFHIAIINLTFLYCSLSSFLIFIFKFLNFLFLIAFSVVITLSTIAIARQLPFFFAIVGRQITIYKEYKTENKLLNTVKNNLIIYQELFGISSAPILFSPAVVQIENRSGGQVFKQKRFYYRETILYKRISTLAERLSTLL